MDRGDEETLEDQLLNFLEEQVWDLDEYIRTRVHEIAEHAKKQDDEFSPMQREIFEFTGEKGTGVFRGQKIQIMFSEHPERVYIFGMKRGNPRFVKLFEITDLVREAPKTK